MTSMRKTCQQQKQTLGAKVRNRSREGIGTTKTNKEGGIIKYVTWPGDF
jgi:hypothetical protein